MQSPATRYAPPEPAAECSLTAPFLTGVSGSTSREVDPKRLPLSPGADLPRSLAEKCGGGWPRALRVGPALNVCGPPLQGASLDLRKRLDPPYAQFSKGGYHTSTL